MNRFYEVVVKYDKMVGDGNIERVTEQYLLHAVSCTDAEASLIKDIEAFIKGECDVVSVKLSKYTEFIPEDVMISKVDGYVKQTLKQNTVASTEANKYFGVKVSFITINEKGKKKKTPYHYLVFATSVDASNDTVEQFMKDSMDDWEINGVTETKIVDVILFP